LGIGIHSLQTGRICDECAKDLYPDRYWSEVKKGEQFSIGSHLWPGLGKLIEEAGEVQQVCGKLIGSGGRSQHWNDPDLRLSLTDELGDLLAAIDFVVEMNELNSIAIQERRRIKLERFQSWHTREVK
jgi:NTP pyrophosphatase (non-canonical NTP hydrolase)